MIRSVAGSNSSAMGGNMVGPVIRSPPPYSREAGLSYQTDGAANTRNSGSTGGIRILTFPRISFSVIIVSLLLGGWSFLLLTWIEQAGVSLGQRRQVATDHLNNLFQTEELIAMTVAGSIWTGETRWVQRYQGYLEQFSQRLATCVAHAPHETRTRLATLAKDAEKRPFLMERKIFDLAKEKKIDDGRSLFESSDYRHMLENSHVSLITFQQSIFESFRSASDNLNHLWNLWRNIFWSSFVLLFVASLVFLSQISNWIFSISTSHLNTLETHQFAMDPKPLSSFRPSYSPNLPDPSLPLPKRTEAPHQEQP